ncbi:MAG: hypothetical protein ACOYD4_00685 [Solirubrobacterales bacterium]
MSELVRGRTPDPAAYVLATAAQAYQLLGCASPQEPAWIPFLDRRIRSAGANPDTVYSFAPIASDRRYRISGFKGTVLFADILAQAGIVGTPSGPGPTVSMLDLDDVEADAEDRVELVLGADVEEGPGCWRVDRRADHLWLRQVAYDWSEAVDGRYGIEALPGRGPVHPEALVDWNEVAAFVRRYIVTWTDHIDAMRERELVNRLELEELPDTTGTVRQSYYQGLFDLAENEVALLEVDLPDRCRYWNVQVTDECYLTVDWRRHNCSINGSQAVLDPDGRFAAVIAASNPGTANWIDTGGLRRGSLLGRWNFASEHPKPSITLISADEARERMRRMPPAPVDRPDRGLSSQWRRAC